MLCGLGRAAEFEKSNATRARWGNHPHLLEAVFEACNFGGIFADGFVDSLQDLVLCDRNPVTILRYAFAQRHIIALSSSETAVSAVTVANCSSGHVLKLGTLW